MAIVVSAFHMMKEQKVKQKIILNAKKKGQCLFAVGLEGHNVHAKC